MYPVPAPVPRPIESDAAHELTVEEVAARLGLPVSMLVRRIEAGDVPARRIEHEDRVEYRLRLADLGVPDVPEPEPHGAHHPAAGAPLDDADDVVFAVPPPPLRRGSVELAPYDEETSPRAELAAMSSIDPRELVAGLLDRWERTLEQRIYAEQRQRFESELTTRQGQIKQLQLELEAARAQHAAALAERDRIIAERERELSERERWLTEAQLLTDDQRGRRGGWFRRR